MKESMSREIWKTIQSCYLVEDSWNTSNFQIRDETIRHRLPFTPPTKIYSIIRYKSLKAEELIAKRIRNKGEDYYTAKIKVKHDTKYPRLTSPLPLLIKRPYWGWFEPTFEDLSDDSKKRLIQAEKHFDFAETRDDNIQKMKPIRLRNLIDEDR